MPENAAPIGPALSCQSCALVLSADRDGSDCPRCQARLEPRTANSLITTTALVLGGMIFYLPANLLPMAQTIQFTDAGSYTVLGGVIEFVQANLIALAVLVFVASFAIPLLKLAGMAWLLWSVHSGSTRALKLKTKLHHIIHEGRPLVDGRCAGDRHVRSADAVRPTRQCQGDAGHGGVSGSSGIDDVLDSYVRHASAVGQQTTRRTRRPDGRGMSDDVIVRDEDYPERTEAIIHRGRWPGLIWALPIAALLIAAWLLLRALTHPGISVILDTPTAQGVRTGDTHVTYNGLEIGSVSKIALAPDGHHIRLTLTIEGSKKGLFRDSTKIWIVGANPSFTNIASLRAAVAGPNIGVQPGAGQPRRHFAAILDAPLVSDETRAGISSSWPATWFRSPRAP